MQGCHRGLGAAVVTTLVDFKMNGCTSDGSDQDAGRVEDQAWLLFVLSAFRSYELSRERSHETRSQTT